MRTIDTKYCLSERFRVMKEIKEIKEMPNKLKERSDLRAQVAKKGTLQNETKDTSVREEERHFCERMGAQIRKKASLLHHNREEKRPMCKGHGRNCEGKENSNSGEDKGPICERKGQNHEGTGHMS